MSKRKNIERALSGHSFRNNKPAPVLFLRCKKCNLTMPEGQVAAHIKECHGGKAECDKCHRWIKADDFIEHWNSCERETNY